jgi:hypothetical protein
MALAVVGVFLLGGAYWAGTEATSPSALGRQYAPAPPTELTASVVFRRLAETLPVQGTVTAEAGYQVNFGPVNVAGAQPIVTQQPPGPGTRVANGSLLAQVAGRPVFAMLGTTPMYRDLAVGDRGPDVAQLQADLAALGFPSYDALGVFGSDTLRAARAFYGYKGYSLPEPAGSSPAQAKPMWIPRSAARGTGASPSASATSPTPASSPSASAGSPSPTSSPSASASPASTPPAHASSPPPASPPVVPQAEVVFIPRLPATIQSSALKLGLPVTNPALTLSTEGLRVIVPLTGGQADLVQPKDTASLHITGAGGTVTDLAATVIAIRAAGQGTQPGPVAVLRPAKPLRWSLTGAQAAGTIVIASTAQEVLAVPVAALYTAPDGQTLVTVVAPHEKRASVPVQVGAEIGGYVPVRPIQGHLAAGELVLVGQ